MNRPDGNTLALSGAVTAETYAELRAAAAAQVGQNDLAVDWSAVEQVDSSAVALILAWQRDAARTRVSIEHRQLPEALVALIDLYGLSTIIAAGPPEPAAPSSR